MTAAASQALASLSVVVTRAANQASSLADQLVAHGAVAVPIPMIEIVPPADGGAALATAVASLGQYDQLVVSSPNGARALAAQVDQLLADGGDPELPPVACVGPSTAAVLASSPLTINCVPDKSVAEGLLSVMPRPAPGRDRLLLAQAAVARDVLPEGLDAMGWQVDRVIAYETIDAQVSSEQRAAAASADVVAFTSSSTVERFLRLVGAENLPPTVASIGPITSATARALGLSVDVEAQRHTIEGLVEALLGWANS